MDCMFTGCRQSVMLLPAIVLCAAVRVLPFQCRMRARARCARTYIARETLADKKVSDNGNNMLG